MRASSYLSLALSLATFLPACDKSTPSDSGGTGGQTPSVGGASDGGSSTGGATGGTGAGGNATGGVPAGGAGAGGAMEGSGGSSSGGAASGGSSAGASSGGGGSGGGSTGGNSAGGGNSTGGQNARGCAGSPALICDGFETGTIDQDTWTVVTGDSGDVVEVTDTQAARGTHSVHISTQNGYGFLRNQSAFPVPNNDYFGRMFLRVAEFSTVDWAHWTIAEAAGTGDGSLIRVGGQFNTSQGVNRWGVGSDGGPTGDWTNHDADPAGAVQEPPTNQWVCVEWEHKGSANETRFFIDGVEHPSLATTSSNHGGSSTAEYVLPEMTSLWFGWYQYQDDADLRFDVWIDELAIDTARVGCD